MNRLSLLVRVRSCNSNNYKLSKFRTDYQSKRSNHRNNWHKLHLRNKNKVFSLNEILAIVKIAQL